MFIEVFLGIVFSFLLIGAIYSLCETIDRQDWPEFWKLILKAIVWLAGVVGAIIFAAIMSLIVGNGNSKSKK